MNFFRERAQIGYIHGIVCVILFYVWPASLDT